ncbi:MAG: hypothetical protein ACRD88_14620, partial [Terriglobia bacterium]
VQFQVSYTYSRTRDMQSDPLVQPGLASQRNVSRDLANSSFFQITTAFTRQFDPRADYGRSDFDQAHNFVFNAVAQSPRFNGWRRFLGGWQAATLLGIRSGFPFSVHTTALDIPASGGFLVRNRADFVGDDFDEAFLSSPQSQPGGKVLLDRSRFRVPAAGRIGSLPRNALRGPGFWNVDFGLSRSFALPRLGEQGRL